MDKLQFLNHCFSERTTPIIVIKSNTIHKSQGVSIGPGKDWDNVVVTLPSKNTKAHLSMEIVAFSSSTPNASSSIQDDDINGVTVEDLKDIGWSKSYDVCRNFEEPALGTSGKIQA